MSAPEYRWQPTTAEIAAAAGIPVSEVIRFDHNTSPYPTEWAIPIAAALAAGLNEYPGASYRPLRKAAAGYVGTIPERIAVGAGVDELLLLTGRALLTGGRCAVAVTPTYPLYRISTLQVGAELVEVAATGPDLSFPTDAVVDAAGGADVTWLCVPDNPTGARPPDESIAAVLAATDGVVVLDAAYAEFAGDRWTTWTDRHDNLLVLHTLSKAFGVGGIRVGFGVGHPDLVAAIDRVRPPGSIASLSVEIAIAALGNPARMRAQVDGLVAERARLERELRRLGFRTFDSETNFVLCQVGDGVQELAAALRRRGLVVRVYPDAPRLARMMRITVRSSDENGRLIEALEKELA